MIFLIPGILTIITAILYFRQIVLTDNTIINWIVYWLLIAFGVFLIVNCFYEGG